MSRTDQENTEQAGDSRAQSGRMDRFAGALLFALPVSTVVVIALAIFVVGAPRAYRAARVWGGPTTSQDGLSLRVQVFDRLGEVERPVPSAALEMLASHAGRSVHWRGSSDSQGFAHPRLALQTGAAGFVEIELAQGRLPVARGSVRVSSGQWQRGATRRGGWTRARLSDPFAIRVRPARGAFAVPFQDPLVVEVRDANGPVVGASLSFAPEGARVTSHEPLLTDQRGRATVLVSVREHHPTLRIDVALGGRRARWNSSLPVVPGAMHARLEGDKLLIQSPVARDEAFYSFVSEHGRLGGGRAGLAPDGRGGSRALVPAVLGTKEALWAVVSSEPDLQAPATVGWPLVVDSDDPHTFDVHERLWLDGAPEGYAQNQRIYRHARWLAGGYAALALALVVVLLVRRVRSSDERLVEHLSKESPGAQRPPAAGRLGLSFAAALLCVALGFVLVLLLAVYRIGTP